jgi:predicted ATPase
MVGRSDEIAELRRRLTETKERLVTIHGPGGIGKTRVAIHVALTVLEGFIDGVFFVDLTTATHDGVEMAIADTLGDNPQDSGTNLPAAIGNRQMLLVLDNFEHVIEATKLVAELVGKCPRLAILVTSQVILRVHGESPLSLAPLHAPIDDSVEAVLKSDAARLFARRAVAVRPQFEISSDNAGAISRICRLLDGLPLALELAAARLRLFSIDELAAHLDDSLKLLTAGARDAPPRHQTLRATVDWSYGLLSPSGQAFFRDFAVFRGGATLPAIETVIDAGGDALDTLMSLVEHNLVRRSDDAGGSYFSMLRTIGGYAAELLREDPHRDEVRERHAAYYLQIALADPEDLDHHLDRDIDNFRAALDWWVSRAEGGDKEAGLEALQLATALGRFWYRHGHAVEGIAWFDRALKVSDNSSTEIYASALRRLGILVEATRDLDRAHEVFAEALDVFRSLKDKDGEAAALNSLGVVMRSLGDLDAAEKFFEAAIDLRRDLGDEGGLSTATSNLGIAAADRGDFERAQRLLETALELDRSLDDIWAVTVDANNLAVIHLERGNHKQANRMVAQALSGFSDMGDLDGLAESFEVSAGIAGATGNPISAARMAGAAKALRASAGLPLAPPDRRRLERWMAQPRRTLSAADFDRNLSEGAAMTPDQATSYALRHFSDPRQLT